MKCPEKKCGAELNPARKYETDLQLDKRTKRHYREVCGRCYKKILKRNCVATVQAGVGRQGSTEGKTSTAVASQLALAW